MQHIFETCGRCILRGINCFKPEIIESVKTEIKEIKRVTEEENIDLVVGIHVFRTGVVLKEAFGMCESETSPI